ncbi:MAG: DOMON-like domain-containing protein [Parasphingopyxis sp.]|uniref:DOMON-like domain-containing protein n=1 Tax=Parasphingopyxis sp. TaxID=1920299 RepID=UPI003FA0DBEB
MKIMHPSLFPHPATLPSCPSAIDVLVERQFGQLRLEYRLNMPAENLRPAGPAKPQRTDGLWQSTCFEMFVRRPGETWYCEFNFSPRRAWAAYVFDDVREGMRNLPLDAAPAIDFEGPNLDADHPNGVELAVRVEMPEPWASSALAIGLSAVIEEVNGTKSYWALAHPSEKPDFHHPDCFTLELPPPEAP